MKPIVTNTSFKNYKNAEILWAFLFSSTFFLSIAFTYSKIWIGSLAILSAFSIYLVYSSNEGIQKFKFAFFAMIVLFLQGLFISNFTARSTALTMQVIASFFLLCALHEIFKDNGHEETNHFFSRIRKSTKNVLLVFGLFHACALITGYIYEPVRQAGVLMDYSQASFIILLIFGLTYSHVRENKYFYPLTLILFLGFFTAYSRTSNALLVLFLIFLSYHHYKKALFKQALLISATILLASLIVYLYPYLTNEQIVNRGGLSDVVHLNSRVYYWQFAVDAIKQSPLLGHGLGNFEYLGAKEQFPYQTIGFAHNDYLNVWVELGLLWFIVVVGTIAYFLLRYIPFNRDLSIKQHSLDAYVSWVLFLCVTLYMAINFIIFAMPFQILICIILVQIRKND